MNLIKGPVHFIGIGGAGMSGIAKILLEMGVVVAGSDLKDSESTRRIRDLGARVSIGHAAQNITNDLTAVVFSSAIPQDNPEILEAKRLGLKVMARAEMLAELIKLQQSIAVAGAHGKTTTTAMISLVLEMNGLDPTIVIGGDLRQIGSNAKLGRGKYLVAEADESDGSFLKLFPQIAVITNIENDHLDYYRSVHNIVNAFIQFVEQIPQDGFIVLCLDDKELAKIKETVPGNYITYGIKRTDADYIAKNIKFNGLGSKCEVYFQGERLGRLSLNVPGVHNITNALAAIAIGRELGLSFDQAAKGLKQFTGAKRRFELIEKVNGITIVDDYAHHPTELRATLKAAKSAGFERTIAIFQPHRYSRTKLLQFEFGESFFDADLVVINEIYSASEKPIPGVSAQLIVNAVTNSNHKAVVYCKTEDDILEFMKKESRPGDLIITLGAGNIRQAGIRLADELKSGGRKM